MKKHLKYLIGEKLIKRGLKIAVAESCTGGLISDMLTDVPGISASFLEGLVCYSNNAKIRLLGVPQAMIQKFGAVSYDVAKAMANGVARRSNADIGVSTTGIAGPTGGTREKPVGLVYIGLYTARKTLVKKFLFKGSRREIKESASEEALKFLDKILKHFKERCQRG